MQVKGRRLPAASCEQWVFMHRHSVMFGDSEMQAATLHRTEAQPTAATEKFPPLEQVTRPHVPTEQAAYYLNRKPQTLRECTRRRDGWGRWRRRGGFHRPKCIAGGGSCQFLLGFRRALGNRLRFAVLYLRARGWVLPLIAGVRGHAADGCSEGEKCIYPAW